MRKGAHCSNEYNQKWRDTHREQFREILRRNSKERRTKLRTEIIKLLGGKCSNPNCLVVGGCSDIRCLQIDHLNLEAKHREKHHGQALGGNETYMREVLASIKAGSKDYQLLCANCNWIKRVENKEDGYHNKNVTFI